MAAVAIAVALRCTVATHGFGRSTYWSAHAHSRMLPMTIVLAVWVSGLIVKSQNVYICWLGTRRVRLSLLLLFVVLSDIARLVVDSELILRLIACYWPVAVTLSRASCYCYPWRFDEFAQPRHRHMTKNCYASLLTDRDRSVWVTCILLSRSEHLQVLILQVTLSQGGAKRSLCGHKMAYNCHINSLVFILKMASFLFSCSA